MSGINILKTENLFKYFENKPEQLGTFKRTCMNKSALISIPIQVTSKPSSQLRSVVNGKNEKTEWKAWKNNYAR